MSPLLPSFVYDSNYPNHSIQQLETGFILYRWNFYCLAIFRSEKLTFGNHLGAGEPPQAKFLVETTSILGVAGSLGSA